MFSNNNIGGNSECHVSSTMGLYRFTLRGKAKVNSQWLMYCMVHNLKKIHQFAPGYALD
jgi:hypothetical protein